MFRQMSVTFLLILVGCLNTARGNTEEVTELGRKFHDMVTNITHKNPTAEFVFVLDSSGSITAENFPKEIEFVRMTTTLLSVSERGARVAVVSYSSCGRIDDDLDYITSPQGKNKCTLDDDLQQYTFHAGGTCTHQGLIRAGEILTPSQQDGDR